MTATIIFNCDPSVGDFSRSYQMELPLTDFPDIETREEWRKQIAALYTEIDGEYFVNSVIFEDENN